MPELKDTQLPVPEVKAVEDWRQIKGTHPGYFAGAKHLRRWVEGEQVTEAAYDQAVAEITAQKWG